MNLCRAKIALYIISVSCMAFVSNAQTWRLYNYYSRYDSIVDILKTKLCKGDKNALKDLGDLLSNNDTVIDHLGYHQLQNTVAGIARRTLQENFAFTEEEIKANILASQEDFIRFFVQNENQIVFSDIAGCFVLTPFDKRKVEYDLEKIDLRELDNSSLLMKSCLDDLKDACDDEDPAKDMQADIDKIGALRTKAAEEFLHSCFTKNFFKEYKYPKPQEVRDAACRALRFFPSDSNVQFIVKQWQQKNVNSVPALNCLEVLTNIPAHEMVDSLHSPMKYMMHCIDSLKVVTVIRQFGYSLYFQFSLEYFQNKEDYYGKIMVAAGDNNILRQNAFYDLLALHNPCILKYLAAIVYQHRTRWNIYYFDKDADFNPVHLIEQLTGIKVKVKGDNEIYEYSDPEAAMNYLVYWYNHYSDYKWNSETGRFENTKEMPSVGSNLDILFRQLNSKIDSVAASAYSQLADGEPDEVKKKLQEYRYSMWDLPYGGVPMFADKRLVAQVEFFDFCRKNSIVYKPSAELKKRLDSLNDLQDSKLYNCENRLISSLKLDEITGVEYWGSISSENAPYSLGRILDKFYTNHFNEIVTSTLQLRLYLKKAYEYNRFGIIGTCGKYLWKFGNCSSVTKQQLNNLQNIETDSDIMKEIGIILYESD